MPVHTHGRRRAAVGVLAVLVTLSLAACSGSDDSSSSTARQVALMHVGTDHMPPSFGSLVARLEEAYGWELPDAEVDACLEEQRLSCNLSGESLELFWRNLEPDAAATQADVFVRQGVDVIVAYEDRSISSAQDATAELEEPTPIVFLHPSDPVRDGLTDSLSRPSTNLTGVYGPRDVVAKQLELYQLLVGAQLRRVLTLVDPADPATERLLPEYTNAAAELQRPLELDIREATTEQDLRRIFGSLKRGEVDGAFLLSPSLRLNHSAITIRLAKRAGLPVQAHRKEWVEQGALFSYGIDLVPIGAEGARYVDSILDGTSPADLPVDEIPETEFAINLATAGRLGIKVPQDMIIRADQVYR